MIITTVDELEKIINNAQRMLRVEGMSQEQTLKYQAQCNCSRLVKSEVQQQASKSPKNRKSVQEICLKFLQSTVETAQAFKKSSAPVPDTTQAEIEFYRSITPQVLNEVETRNLVVKLVESVGATSMRDIGKVMQALKAYELPPEMSINMKVASGMVREELNK